jgi:hypothetical protein
MYAYYFMCIAINHMHIYEYFMHFRKLDVLSLENR